MELATRSDQTAEASKGRSDPSSPRTDRKHSLPTESPVAGPEEVLEGAGGGAGDAHDARGVLADELAKVPRGRAVQHLLARKMLLLLL